MPSVKAPATLEWNLTALGLNLRDATKQLKTKYKWLPTALKVSPWGGFISPRCMFYDIKAENYEDAALIRGYLYVPNDKRDRWQLQDWAIYNGWVQLGWYQSYGHNTVNFSPYITRRLIITIYKLSDTLSKPEFFMRLLQTVRFYEELFNQQLVYEVKVIDFLGLDDPTVPVVSYIDDSKRMFSSYAVDMYLQLLRQRKYNEAKDFLS